MSEHQHPIETVAGIVERINADVRPQSQCPSTFGGTSVSFCQKRKGHDGDHRGYRAQWNASGRVKITEKCP